MPPIYFRCVIMARRKGNGNCDCDFKQLAAWGETDQMIFDWYLFVGIWQNFNRIVTGYTINVSWIIKFPAAKVISDNWSI